MAITVKSKIANVRRVTRKNPPHVAARSRTLTYDVLEITMQRGWKFDTPAYKGKPDDWFDDLGSARVQPGDEIEIRGTVAGPQRLNRVRRIWTGEVQTRTVSVAVPTDTTLDAVDAYRSAMDNREWTAALSLARSAERALAQQQELLRNLAVRLEDDLAFLTSKTRRNAST